MDIILGIDLGTTNSEIAVIRDGRPVVLEEDGDPILPSVVGLDPQGKVLVGRAARNQFVLAPERTIKSIKRKMGEDTKVRLGDQNYTPQEISAIILRRLKQRAEECLGGPATKAVITVPAFFNDAQRDATREAGHLAGLEVLRIINEPTAAVLTYDPHPPEMERLLVYDLGGGTFDVSIAQVESGVVEILASHGDTQLGGDDFDQRLLDFVCDEFQTEHGIDLRASPASRSRMLHAVEEAKKQLSFEPSAVIAEEFIAEKDGLPLNLDVEIERCDYERLIEPLLAKTLRCVDRSLSDANLQAPQIDKVLLVGGATRTPLVHRMLSQRLGRPVHSEIEPDLAVAMGAAVQAGLIAGVDVGPVLVDVTPHTLGIETVHDDEFGMPVKHCFSAIIERNTPLPAVRTEIYSTYFDGQTRADIRVFQGESDDVRHNMLVGEFAIEGLADVPAPNEILVRFDLDVSGILRVTAKEKTTGLERRVTIDNALERFRKRQRAGAIARLDELLGAPAVTVSASATEGTQLAATIAEVRDPGGKASDDPTASLVAKARQAAAVASAEDAAELDAMIRDLQAAVARRSKKDIDRLVPEIEDLVFYLQDK